MSPQETAKGEIVPLGMDTRDQISTASIAISRLAALARWAGRGLVHTPNGDVTSSARDEVGFAIIFLGEEIERRCAVIDEVAL